MFTDQHLNSWDLLVLIWNLKLYLIKKEIYRENSTVDTDIQSIHQSIRGYSLQVSESSISLG